MRLFRLSLPFVALMLAWVMPAGDAGAVKLNVGTGRALLSSAVPTAPAWVLCSTRLPGPCPLTQAASVDCNFSTGLYWYSNTLQSSCPVSITRASSGTNLLPTSASGFAYTTFGNNVLRTTGGSGLLVEESRTNQLLNSAAPVTQTTGSLGTGTYTLWVNGAGSATMSAGTGTGCGTGAATNGTPITFTITIAGTCTVTVAGALNAFQLEAGGFGTSLVVTTGAAATRAVDNITISPLIGYAGGAAWMYSESQVSPSVTGVLTNGGLAFYQSIAPTTNSIEFYNSTRTNSVFEGTASGAGQFSISVAGLVSGGIIKAAGTFATNVADAAANNILGTEDISVTIPPTINKANVGAGRGQNFWTDGYVRRVAWGNGLLSRTQVQGLTQ